MQSSKFYSQGTDDAEVVVVNSHPRDETPNHGDYEVNFLTPNHA